LTFLKVSYICGLGEFVAWHLVDRRGIKVDSWERGGLGFNSDWWELISFTTE
jgi:hypothetical protein